MYCIFIQILLCIQTQLVNVHVVIGLVKLEKYKEQWMRGKMEHEETEMGGGER